MSDSLPPARRTNRRRAPRSLANGLTRAECRKGSLGLGRNLAVRALDISQTGVRLLLSAGLTAGEEVEVLLTAPGVRGSLKRPGRVAWCLAVADGGHCAGINFDKPLPFAELHRLSRPGS